jgi:intracellular sulfur oxidation DsrE/DsrF family protein
MKMKKMLKILSLGVLLGLSTTAPLASQPTDQRALQGVEQGKAIFDVNHGNPKTIKVILDVIGETLDGLTAHQVEPDVIVAFRGPSVRFVTTDKDKIPADQAEAAAQVVERVQRLIERGVRFEACGITTRMMGIDNAKLVDGVEPVANTFNSLIGYQAKGYALIPIM